MSESLNSPKVAFRLNPEKYYKISDYLKGFGEMPEYNRSQEIIKLLYIGVEFLRANQLDISQISYYRLPELLEPYLQSLDTKENAREPSSFVSPYVFKIKKIQLKKRTPPLHSVKQAVKKRTDNRLYSKPRELQSSPYELPPKDNSPERTSEMASPQEVVWFIPSEPSVKTTTKKELIQNIINGYNN